MKIDPTCTYASIPVDARNTNVIVTLRDALAGVFAWPVFVHAREPEVARKLVHATVNHIRGDLARKEELFSLSMSWMLPTMRSALRVDIDRYSALQCDALVVDGVDKSPLTAETIIWLARMMDAMHAARRPIVTISSLANDSATGLLAQLTTRYAGGRPLEWHCPVANADTEPTSGRTRARRRRGAMVRRAPG